MSYDWCNRCWYLETEICLDELTVPDLFHAAYVWLVERDWGWFERFDMWLVKHSPWLPRWWEY